MKRLIAALLTAVWLLAPAAPARAAASETVIPPAWEVPEEIQNLLDIAAGEVGYREGAHGYSKYGEWAGDPYAQWCAEYLCWCVDQVDQRYGTQLLNHQYPLYSGSNTGKNWFIRQGRYVVRWGNLDGWGYQWLKGEDHFLSTGDYIPQPGDWVFFTWDSDQNTDHVAMVEYCTRSADGDVTIHVLEGNTPVSVKRATYPLTYNRILGYGTVRDVADVTMRGWCQGEKVRLLQENLIYLAYLPEGSADGLYGEATAEAVRTFQAASNLKQTGVADMATQRALQEAVDTAVDNDPATWLIVDDE